MKRDSLLPFTVRRAVVKIRLSLALTWRKGARRRLWVNAQSPYIYSFLTEVVKNRSAYYAYDEFKSRWRTLDSRERRVAKLMFRVANRIQPDVVFLERGEGAKWAGFLKRGCLSAEIEVYADGADLCRRLSMPASTGADTQSPKSLVILNPANTDILSLIEQAGPADGSALIAPDIRSTPAHRRGWQRLCSAPWASVSIDLYFTGLILVNPVFHSLYYKAVI